MKIDFSQISQYTRCPFAWKKKYIDGVRGQPSVNLRLGSAVHAVLERYGKESCISLSGKRKDVYRATPTKPGDKLLKAEWDEQARKYNLPHTAYDSGLGMIKTFIKSFPRLDPVEVEHYFELPMDGFILYGTIDRVDLMEQRKLFVIDYKTSQTMPTRQEVDDNLQLSIYCMAMREKFGWINKTINAGLHMLRFDAILWTQRSEDDDKRTKEYCASVVDRIKNNKECKPTINNFCTWCDISHMCDAYKAISEDNSNKFNTTSTHKELLDEYERLSNNARILYAEKKRLEERIRAIIQHEGPIETDNKVCNISVIRNKKYPATQTVNLLQKYGILDSIKTTDSLLSVTNKELTKLMENLEPLEYELLKEDLKKIVQYRCSSRIVRKEKKQ